MIDPARFDPQGFYTGMAESKSMLIRRDEVRWSERAEAPDRPVDALLAFGCAVQHTPHLMLEATRVFDVLGIDYAAVTGKQFCCGRPFGNLGGDAAAADRISSRSYERFAAYGPNVTVQWCGACMLRYLELGGTQRDAPYKVVHVSKYLSRLLRERGDAIPWQREVRARVVLHRHRESLPQQDIDTESILDILALIPGVEYAGTIEPPSAGAPCAGTGPTSTSILNGLSADEYRRAQGELEEQAARAGAATLVTPYHRCQREWSKFSSPRLAVREWMSLLAEALGVASEDRFSAYWHLADPDLVTALSRPEWESWGLTEDEALAAARRHFTPQHAAEVQQCDCDSCGCGAVSAAAAPTATQAATNN